MSVFLFLFYILEGVDGLLREEGVPTFLFEHKVPGSLELLGLLMKEKHILVRKSRTDYKKRFSI